MGFLMPEKDVRVVAVHSLLLSEFRSGCLSVLTSEIKGIQETWGSRWCSVAWWLFWCRLSSGRVVLPG